MQATEPHEPETEDSESTEQLVIRARRKDSDAFATLIGRYERVALSVAYGVLGNADSASDAVQEAFLRAWQRLAELKEPARFATWVCGIARNLAIDARRKARHLKLSFDPAAYEESVAIADRVAADPLEELTRREQHALVAAALQSLDEATRPAVVLRYYDGLSSKEIARILDLSPAAVDMRLSRARQQLKKLLSPTGSEQKPIQV